MKSLPKTLGRQILLSRMLSTNKKAYYENLKKEFTLLPEKLLPWKWSFDELFEQETLWFSTIVTSQELYNGIYRSVCNTYGFYDKENPCSVEKISEHYLELPQKDKEIIEHLRKDFDETIPIIAITINKKEFYIYDGFHAAIACCLENKKIPIIFAYRKDFSCIFAKPNITNKKYTFD